MGDRLTAAQVRALRSRTDDRYFASIDSKTRATLMAKGFLCNERPTPAGIAALARQMEEK